MNISDLMLILRARYKLILLSFFVVVGVTTAVTLVLPKSYKATTLMVLNYKGVDPVTGLTLPAQLMPGYMPTQVDIINSSRVALKVVDDLKLTDDTALKAQYQSETGGNGDMRNWLADSLMKKLEVVPARDSSVLDISFKSPNAAFSAAVANAYARAYQQTSIQLRVEPSQKASSYFNDQIKILRERLEVAQRNLTTYQRNKGIVNAEGRLDLESARLNELSSQLVIAQGQSMEAASRQRQVQNSAENSPDVIANPFIQSLKASLSTAEAKFADTAQKLDRNHPRYQAAKSEVDKLRSNLQEQIKIAAGGVSGTARILQQREAEIRSALAQQKARVLELDAAHNEIKVLTNEMESAQKAYEAVSQRYSQTNMESQFNQTDIAILSPAVAPTRPTGPNLPQNLLIAAVLGLCFGLSLALILELGDRRIRSMSDIVTLTHVPLLGAIDWNHAGEVGKNNRTPLLTFGTR